jgi:predicted dinucleotide-binding enzyme
MKTIGLIGAGHIGSQLARLAVKNGYNVVISNSRGPETLADLVTELGPPARAATPEEAAHAGDIVVVTIPLKNLRYVPVAPLAGKIVIDTLNYYPQRDGHIADLDDEKTTTSETVQQHLPGSHVVKAFNHIYAAELTVHGQPAGTPNRRALAIAGTIRQRTKPSPPCLISLALTRSILAPSARVGAFSATRQAMARGARRMNSAKTWRQRNVRPSESAPASAESRSIGRPPPCRGRWHPACADQKAEVFRTSVAMDLKNGSADLSNSPIPS